MDRSESQKAVASMPFGKRLPTALYVHREAWAALSGRLGALLDQVVARYQIGPEFNVVKFRTEDLNLSATIAWRTTRVRGKEKR